VKPAALRRRANELTHVKRPGCAVVLRILDELHPELARSRNEWEALVARRAKQCGLEPPQLEYELHIDGHRYIADAGWMRFGITALALERRDNRAFRQVARAIARREASLVLHSSGMRCTCSIRGHPARGGAAG